MTDTVVAIVPARAGSKGLPGKNTRRISGRSLWELAMEQGRRNAARIVLTSDIAAIDPSCLSQDDELLRRPASLAADDTPMADVVAHAIDTLGLRSETILLLQPTSPLRSDEDVQQALALHRDHGFDLVMSVSPTSSSILKYGTMEGDAFRPVSKASYCFSNRQALPEVVRPNGAVYVFAADAFRSAGGFPTRSIGCTRMPAERSLDIDSLEDFEKVSAILTRRGGVSGSGAIT